MNQNKSCLSVLTGSLKRSSEDKMRVETKAWKQLIALGTAGAGEVRPKLRKGRHLVDKFKQGGRPGPFHKGLEHVT